MTDNTPTKIVLGIDPGTNIMGYSLLDVSSEPLKVLSFGVIDVRKITDHYLKLAYIYDRTKMLIEQYAPDELAIEAPFFGKNVQSMLKLGRAQGVAMTVALSHKIPIFEYAPLKVKQAITGNGKASKEQVAVMLLKFYGIQEEPSFLDATDALAVATCHYFQRKQPYSEKKSSKSWSDFVKKNPDKLI